MKIRKPKLPLTREERIEKGSRVWTGMLRKFVKHFKDIELKGGMEQLVREWSPRRAQLSLSFLKELRDRTNDHIRELEGLPHVGQ